MVARKSIDVSNNEELRRLAEEVDESGEERLLAVDGKVVAVVTPFVGPIVKRAEGTKEAHEAFLSSFGAWKGLVDAEAIKKASRASRSITKSRPSL